jgi:hypothetical protein
MIKTREYRKVKDKKCTQKITACQLWYRYPAAFPSGPKVRLIVARPVSGLVSIDIAPSQAINASVADCNSLKLTYRCGGSIGLIKIKFNAPISQFHLVT